MEPTKAEAAEMPAVQVREGRDEGDRTRRTSALVARPLPAPAGLSELATRRWELFAPALNASLLEAVQAASEALLTDADETAAADRRRLAFAAARALHARLPRLPQRIPSALAQLFLAPEALEESLQADVGAFAVQQLADRLLRADARALASLGNRLHGERGLSAPTMAARLAGLLDLVVDGPTLPTHARNVVCAFFARRLEVVLPGLAGRTRGPQREAPPTLDVPAPPRIEPGAETPAPPAAPAPRALLQALTRLQQEALDDRPVTELAPRARKLACASRIPVAPEALEQGLLCAEAEARALEKLLEDRRVPGAVAAVVTRLAPVLARSAVSLGARHPGAGAFVATLLQGALDLADADRDPRLPLLEDLCGEALVRYVDDDGVFCELLESAHGELSGLRQRQRDVRTRARERACADRRRACAREATATACARLALREGLTPLVEGGWRAALQLAHLRYGPGSVPWRRMLTLGDQLLLADRETLATLRPAVADALGLALPDATEAERLLDRVLARPGAPLDPGALETDETDATEDRAEHRFADGHAWLLPDGRRRWVLVQPTDGDGEVLLVDALARHLDWLPATTFAAWVDRGEAVPLDPDALLAGWLAGD